MGFLWIGAAAFLVFLLQEMIYQKHWEKGLSVKLSFSHEAIREGGEGRLKEVVQNRKWLPLPVLHVNLQSHRALVFANQENTSVSDQVYRRDIFSLLPYQQITRTLSFVGTKRGYYRCQEAELIGTTLFFQGPFVKKEPQQAFLYVYPKAIGAKPVETACMELLGEYRWKKKLFEDPFSFQGIRDYEPYDGFRQVNWKAYGRTGQLKVNVYEHRAMAKVRIRLNLEGDSLWTKEILPETVIRIGGALAEQWIGLGIPVEIRTNGRDAESGSVIRTAPGAGNGHRETVLKALSRIDLGKGTAGNLWETESGRGSLDSDGMEIYVSCSSRNEDLICLEGLRRRGKTILWIRVIPGGNDKTQEKRAGERQPEAKIYQGRILEWRAEE